MEKRDSSQWQWPLWGAAAGISGYVGHLLTISDASTDQSAQGQDAVIAALDHRMYHIGVVAGIVAVFCLLVFAAGWRRWANEEAPSSLAASVVSLALVASAGAMILGYGFKGALAVYLPGGSDEGTHPAAGLYSLYMFDDFGPFIAWYGVAMAATAVAWLSLRERRFHRWIGVVSALFAVVPFGFLVATGLPGFPAVVDPLWLIIISVGLAVTFRNRASRPELVTRSVLASGSGVGFS